MDDITFNWELNNIKRRLPSYGPSSIPAAPEDMFADDLAALKSRLRSMEASLSFLNTSHGQREASRVRTDSAPSVGSLHFTPSTLPPDHLFRQLCTSLKADVRRMDARMAGIEHQMSNLEDRVDRMDPNQFTPPGTNTTSASPPWASGNSSSPFSQQTSGLPCDPNYQHCGPAWSPYQSSQFQDQFYSTTQYGVGVEATNWAETSSGIAFRDREIVSRAITCSKSWLTLSNRRVSRTF